MTDAARCAFGTVTDETSGCAFGTVSLDASLRCIGSHGAQLTTLERARKLERDNFSDSETKQL